MEFVIILVAYHFNIAIEDSCFVCFSSIFYGARNSFHYFLAQFTNTF